MFGPIQSRKAYITITIGTLLLSGAFMVLSINYANTTGVFYTARNSPIIHFTTELEAITSLLYSLPEDASVEYRGPYACSWSNSKNKFVCEGGLEIDDISAAVSFTKDERQITSPRTACIYVSIGALKAVAGKAKKVFSNVVEEAGEETVELFWELTAKESGQQARKSARKKLTEFVEWAKQKAQNAVSRIKNIRARLGSVDYDIEFFIERFQKTPDEIREGLLKAIRRGDTTFATSPTMKRLLRDGSDEAYVDFIMDRMRKFPDEAMSRNAMGLVDNKLARKLYGDSVGAVEDAGRKLYGNAYYHLKKGERSWYAIDGQIDLLHDGDLDDWIAAGVTAEESTRRILMTEVVDGTRQLKPIAGIANVQPYILQPKTRYYRELKLWGKTAASAYSAYRSCRSDNIIWEGLNLLMGNQILFRFDLDSADSFYDFYAGKYGAVTVDFSDGMNDITAVKSYGVNGEDLCFLRSQLSYFGGDYSTPSLTMSDGKIEISKNKEIFDTLCAEGDEYYPIGVGEIADYVKKACEGEVQNFNVYVTPARFFSHENGMLCENRTSRNYEGEMVGSFRVLCYDFADISCPVDVGFDSLNIEYDLKEGPIVQTTWLEDLINPEQGELLSGLTESGNTYWFKHPSYLLTGAKIDVPVVGQLLEFLLGLVGQESPLVTFSNILSDILPDATFESRSEEIKPGFFQSMYYRCQLSASESSGTVDLINNGCEPVVLMNWYDILTENYKCGDGNCDDGLPIGEIDLGETSVNCDVDCI
jgi:hypothetical protein